MSDEIARTDYVKVCKNCGHRLHLGKICYCGCKEPVLLADTGAWRWG